MAKGVLRGSWLGFNFLRSSIFFDPFFDGYFVEVGVFSFTGVVPLASSGMAVSGFISCKV